MKIGDHVRMKRGTESGRVIKMLPAKMVEIETEDGFSIPALMSDLVVVSQTEHEYFGTAPAPAQENQATQDPFADNVDNEAPAAQSENQGGYYFSLEESGENLSLFLYNMDNYASAITIVEQTGNKEKGIFLGIINPGTNILVKDYYKSQIKQLPNLVVRGSRYSEEQEPPLGIFEYQLSLDTKTLAAGETKDPYTENTRYEIGLEQEKVDKTELMESMMESKPAYKPSFTPKRVETEVDLHIEELLSSHEGMSNDEILRLQIGVFEKHLDKAIANGQDGITFIHGLGNGVLRDAIHKTVSKHPHIQYFEDAQKQKFGFGATYVKL